MSGVTAGTLLGSAAIGAGGMALGGYLGRGDGMQQGYDIYEPDWLPHVQPWIDYSSQYGTSELDRIRQGRAPQYLESALPVMRQMMVDPIHRQYYGTEGSRGQSVVGSAQQAGAQAGIGARPMMAQVNKAAEKGAFEEQQIDNYLASLIPQYAQNQQALMMQQMNQLPRHKDFQVINLMGGVNGDNQAPMDLSGFADMLGTGMNAYMNRPKTQAPYFNGSSGGLGGAAGFSSGGPPARTGGIGGGVGFG